MAFTSTRVMPDIGKLHEFFTKKVLKKVEFDDRVDQLNYFFTPTLILAFAAVVSVKMYGGQPMNCLLPTTFGTELKKYATDYCFVENIYFVGLKEDIPEVFERESREFKYYPWVPYLLLLQAALFFLPIWAWKNHYRQSEASPDKVIREARKVRATKEPDRRKLLNLLAADMYDCLDTACHEHAYRQTLWYLFTKFLFLLNIVLQFVLMDSFIGRGYNAWCWNVLINVFGLNDPNNTRWKTSPIFPTDALCDLVVRQMGNSHRHTIQCMLVINQFNEKMFLFFSVYFFIVGIITFLNTVSWVFSLLLRCEKYNMVRRLIRKDKLEGPESRKHLTAFVDKALKTDGILLLHFIKGTAGAFVARDVCTKLFVNYQMSLADPRSTLWDDAFYSSQKSNFGLNNNAFKSYGNACAKPTFNRFANVASFSNNDKDAEAGDDSQHYYKPSFGDTTGFISDRFRTPFNDFGTTNETDTGFGTGGDTFYYSDNNEYKPPLDTAADNDNWDDDNDATWRPR